MHLERASNIENFMRRDTIFLQTVSTITLTLLDFTSLADLQAHLEALEA
jgi:hypothetical protein